MPQLQIKQRVTVDELLLRCASFSFKLLITRSKRGRNFNFSHSALARRVQGRVSDAHMQMNAARAHRRRPFEWKNRKNKALISIKQALPPPLATLCHVRGWVGRGGEGASANVTH